MTFDTFLGIAGVLLSIYSIVQAGSAKKIASDAKDEVKELIKTTDFSKLVARLEVAINEVKVFGPSANTKQLRGVDKQKVANHIQDFTLILNENVEQLGPSEKAIAKAAHESLISSLTQFSDPNISIEETKKYGSQIMATLSNLNSKLKKGLNKKITH